MLKLELVRKSSVGLNAYFLFKVNGGGIQSRCISALKSKELFNYLFKDLEGVYQIVESTFGFKEEEIDNYIKVLLTNPKETETFSEIFYEEYSKIKSTRNVPRGI